MGIHIGQAESLPLNTPYPASPLLELAQLLSQGRQGSSDPADLLRLAELYLEIGQDIYQEEHQKLQAFDEGARLAERVLAMGENNAEAHYLYAANLGSSAQMEGVMASALTVKRLKTHVRRALELNPNHPPALHMMGMMLEELPWFLGGDPDMAITYLLQATQVKPDYTRARLDLAKIYIKRHNHGAAREELLKILTEHSGSSFPESWQQDQSGSQEIARFSYHPSLNRRYPMIHPCMRGKPLQVRFMVFPQNPVHS